MRVLRVELEEFDPGNVPALVPIDDLTVIIGRNGVGKSIVLESIERMLKFEPELERRGRGEDPVNPYGWVHARLDVSQNPASDWAWFRKLLADGIPGEEASDIPGDLAEALGGPEHFQSEEDYKQSLEGVTAEEDQSWEKFRWRTHSACVTHEDIALGTLAYGLMAGDEIDVAIQLFPGGYIDLVVDLSSDNTASWLPKFASDLLKHCKSGSSAERIVERLLDPVSTLVHTLRLGGVPQAWEDVQPLIERLPEVVRIRDLITDPERRIDATIDEGLGAAKTGTSWIEDGTDGTARLRVDITAVVARIASHANELLPPFVRDLGSLTIEIERMSAWTGDVPRSVVRWRFGTREGESHFNMLGAGTRRWVAASLEAACADILRVTVGRRDPLYLIDEPELHLHPLSQIQVLRWIEDRVAEGATAVLTTHSPLILATERESARLIGLVRHGRHVGQVDISDNLLDDIGAIDGLADAIGTDRVAALQLTRGILVVEGEHDRKVIKKFFGTELARARIRLLPIRGTKNTMALADSELFASLGLRLCVMFDEVGDSVLASRDIAAAGSAEEKKMLELLNAVDRLRRPGQEVKATAFGLPDVICALPLEAIRRAFPDAAPGIEWSEIIKRWRALSNPKGGFKQYALKQLGLGGIHPDVFLDGTLRAVEASDMPAPELTRAIKTAQAILISFGEV